FLSPTVIVNIMQNVGMFLALIIALSLMWTSAGLTDIDYRLTKSQSGNSSITGENSFHGPSSAKISIVKTSKSIGINLKKPLPIEDLDKLSFWIDPAAGDGDLALTIYLDGDGDDKYSSKSGADARLYTTKASWEKLGLAPGQWNELDAFDQVFKKTGDSKTKGGLSSLESLMLGKRITKISITLYKDGNVTTVYYLDFIKIGSQVISFEPLEKKQVKTGPKSASYGGTMTYTITYGNTYYMPLDIKVTEYYDPRTAFMEASIPPDPGTTNVWTIKQVPPGVFGQIKIKVKALKPKVEADISGHVEGDGYAAVRRVFSTGLEPYQISNTVTISSDEFNLTGSTTTAVRSALGSSVEFSEHGAGLYKSTEALSYDTPNMSMAQELHATRAPMQVDLGGYHLASSGSWFAKREVRVPAVCGLLRENYISADGLSLNSSAWTRGTKSKSLAYMADDSSFKGIALYDYKWNRTGASEMMAGTFRVVHREQAVYYRTHSITKDSWLDCILPLTQYGSENQNSQYDLPVEDEDEENTTDEDADVEDVPVIITDDGNETEEEDT
ncbi:MAG TPA: hypothetical protein VN455_08705, partial [Methanotrichaceae archaeon]|nr:hypothetical protein [Methanotrichaceae archaeon]